MFDQIDHEELALSRIATQFRETVKFKGYIRALLSEANNIEQALQDMITLRSVDNATGFTLDIIGALVGQPRVVFDASSLLYFGFDGASNVDSFGDDANPNFGSRFKSISEASGNARIPEDPEYRLLIRARIARNSSKGTIEDIIQAVAYLVTAPEIRLQETGEASLSIGIGRPLTNNEKSLIRTSNLIPKPAGVTLTDLYDYEAGASFGFVGAEGALGFDSGRFSSSF